MPVSPRRKTGESVGATCSIWLSTRPRAALRPTIVSKPCTCRTSRCRITFSASSAVLQLPDLAEAPLERGLRLLELRHVGVHDDGARVRSSRGTAWTRWWRTPSAGPERVDRPSNDGQRRSTTERMPSTTPLAPACAGPAVAGERGEVVASRRRPRWRGRTRGTRRAVSFIERSRPSPSSSTTSLGRARRMARFSSSAAVMRSSACVAVQGVREDAGEQLEAGQELRRPDPPLRRSSRRRSRRCTCVADDERQRGVRLAARSGHELPLRLGLRRQLVGQEVRGPGGQPWRSSAVSTRAGAAAEVLALACPGSRAGRSCARTTSERRSGEKSARPQRSTSRTSTSPAMPRSISAGMSRRAASGSANVRSAKNVSNRRPSLRGRSSRPLAALRQARSAMSRGPPGCSAPSVGRRRLMWSQDDTRRPACRQVDGRALPANWQRCRPAGTARLRPAGVARATTSS